MRAYNSLACLADRDIFVCIPAVEGEFFSLDKKEMAAGKSCPLRETISPSLAASNYLSPRWLRILLHHHFHLPFCRLLRPEHEAHKYDRSHI